MSRVAIIAALLPLACAFTPAVVHAQGGINRCVNAAGENIYTDQACSDLQAIDRPAPGNGNNLVSSGHRVVVARTCARKPDELLSDVRNALAAQDVNRLAGSYLWTGMGSREAYSLMDRLSVFSARPLVDAQLASSAPEPDPYASQAPPAFISPGEETAEQATPQAVEPAPDMIRIEQTRSANDAETATSYLRIVPAAGCLWVSF
jgi:hypothetical protein